MIKKTNYQKAIEIINQNDDLVYKNNCSNSLINKAENVLNLKFPRDYRDFLLKYGALTFGSEEIYGIIDGDFYNSSIPDAIWFTLSERKEVNMPPNWVVICDLDDGELACLDCKNGPEGYCPVISYTPCEDEKYSEVYKLSDDFGSFLLYLVEMQMEIQERSILSEQDDN